MTSEIASAVSLGEAWAISATSGRANSRPRPAEHVGDRRGVHGRDLAFGDGAVQQALRHRDQVALVGVEQSPGPRDLREICRQGQRFGLDGLVGGLQVGAQRVERPHRRVEGLDRGAADAVQTTVDDGEQQLVLAGRDAVERAQRAAHARRDLRHGEIREALAEELLLELVEQLELPRA